VNKQALRENIETIVRLLPRPLLNGKVLGKTRNTWLILQEYEDGEGIVLLNSITNHEGKVAYDSIREFRKPDMLILRAQVILGKDGGFNLEILADTPSQELPDDAVEILPERLSHAEMALQQCTPDQIRTLRELLIREKMTNYEIHGFCVFNGIPDSYDFFAVVNGRTSFLERDGHAPAHTMWIKPGFVPILSKLLLASQKPLPPS
jgi:hypothetical protein